MDLLSTSFLFEQFLAQRRYLRNVTPSTIEWYQTAFKALQKALGTAAPPLTKSSLQQFVISVRQRGVKPVSCDTYHQGAECLLSVAAVKLGVSPATAHRWLRQAPK